MLDFCYKTSKVHDHRCDVCNIIVKDICTRIDCESFNLCDDCKEDYKRFMERMEKK